MTMPPTFPEYKGPKPRPPANPLIAVHAIGEHATAIAHLNAHSLVPIKGWSAPTVAPNDSPLVLVEKLRGRTLYYQVELPDSPTRKEIIRHLESI